MILQPCQALFVAPCSHTWHYKCIRTILENSKYPSFLCPNCRAQADLDADIEEEELEDFEAYDENTFLGAELPTNDEPHQQQGEGPASPGLTSHILDEQEARRTASPISEPELDSPSLLLNSDDLAWTLNSMSLRQNSAHLASLDDTISAPPPSSRPHTASQTLRGDTQTTAGSSSLNPSANAFVPSPTSSEPVPIPSPRATDPSGGPMSDSNVTRHVRSATLDGTEASVSTQAEGVLPSPNPVEALHREGPMTPRNVAGPFVLDGRGEAGHVNGLDESSSTGTRS